MPFLDSLDIANRALNHLGVNPILSVTEDTTNNNEVAAVYDKVRRAELRRNSWRFAIRKTVLRPVTPTMLELNPGLYSATQVYMQYELARDVNGQIWISLIPDNVGNPQGGNNEAWDMYFGPMTADVWTAGASGIVGWSSVTTYALGNQVVGSDQNVYTSLINGNLNHNPVSDGGVNWFKGGPVNTVGSYQAGELAYVVTGVTPNGYQLFMSLVSNNLDTPNTAQAWSSVVQYNQDQIVSFNGSNWRSLLPVNINNSPAVPPAAWVSNTNYTNGNQVTGSDNFIYTASQNTQGNDPTTDGGVHWTNTNTLAAWTNTPSLFTQDLNWRYITCALKNLVFIYPIGAGPSTQTATANVFRLPAGYVGPAPQNPKLGVMTFLGGPSGNNEPDWELEGNFIISRWFKPIIFRFVADISKVRDMDDMFCEGLACRIAGMLCKRLTGSGELLNQISGMYKTFMGEARLKNGIETGTQEPYEDEYVTIRI